MKKGFIYTTFALLAILTGLIAIIKIVQVAEIIIGLFSLTFGITAIIWATKARGSLSIGSELRKYANLFLLSLLSIILFSFSDLLLFIFSQDPVSVYFYYLKYAFITISYLVFLASSYQILSIGKAFGFNLAGENIKKAMTEKKKSKKV